MIAKNNITLIIRGCKRGLSIQAEIVSNPMNFLLYTLIQRKWSTDNKINPKGMSYIGSCPEHILKKP